MEDRDDLADSTAWVRDTRQTKWHIVRLQKGDDGAHEDGDTVEVLPPLGLPEEPGAA